LQPRERHPRFGAPHLGGTGLLTLVLGTSGQTGREATISQTLLERFGSLAEVANADISELRQVPGIGPSRAVRLSAALQLGRRSLRPDQEQPLIQSALDAYEQLYAELGGRGREMLYALYLNRRKALVGARLLTAGNEAHTIVDPRQVFRPAVRSGACAVIVAHNHPSGDPSPSAQDLAVTRRLAEAGALLGIELLDHLIIGAGTYTSLAEQGLLRSRSYTPSLIRG